MARRKKHVPSAGRDHPAPPCLGPALHPVVGSGTAQGDARTLTHDRSCRTLSRMASVVNGWDGVWGSLIGGLLGAVTALVAVFFAQGLGDSRRLKDEKRAAADALLLEVANARAAAVHSRSKARTGAYDLWPLRHRIYVSHPLRKLPVMAAVQSFYNAVSELREWVRYGPIAQGNRETGDPTDEQAFAEYKRAIEVWADQLIAALQELESPLSDVAAVGPPRPRLPD